MCECCSLCQRLSLRPERYLCVWLRVSSGSGVPAESIRVPTGSIQGLCINLYMHCVYVSIYWLAAGQSMWPWDCPPIIWQITPHSQHPICYIDHIYTLHWLKWCYRCSCDETMPFITLGAVLPLPVCTFLSNVRFWLQQSESINVTSIHYILLLTVSSPQQQYLESDYYHPSSSASSSSSSSVATVVSSPTDQSLR